jgi:FixJ family two-component response regulator
MVLGRSMKAQRGKLMRKMTARSLPDLVKMAGTLAIAA